MSLRRCRTLVVVAALPLLAAVAVGCGTTVNAPERLPGFSYADPAAAATVREDDHVFVQSVDGQEIPTHFSVSLGTHKTYHQFLLPPGSHNLTLLYNQNGNPHSLALGAGNGLTSTSTRSLKVSLLPHHTYTLSSNVDKVYLTFGSATTAKWDPTLTDDAAPKTPAK